MSVSMFSILPVPQVRDDDAMNLIIPFFPLVGAIIGLFWWGLTFIISGLAPMLAAAILMIVPFLLSGFIHLDGYMDTSDAIFSRRSIEEKRKILKDPHVGAFAVIMLAILFLLSFASFTEIAEKATNMIVLLYIPILSRAMIGIFLIKLKPFSNNGYAATFRKNTQHIHFAILCIIVILTISAAFYTNGFTVLMPLGTLLMVSALSAAYTYRQLGGISGDLCGFILTISEFSAVICLALVR